MILTGKFFDRSADVVARELIGCTLCVRVGSTQKIEKRTITETEAYMGPDDLANHASKGRTKRTEVMFGEPGTIYIYLIYGMYEMLNIVTGPKGHPAAVLIRGVGEYDGPGKLSKAFGITRTLNGLPLGKETGLWVECPKAKPFSPLDIEATPRIGVHYAKEWAKKKLRFVLKDR